MFNRNIYSEEERKIQEFSYKELSEKKIYLWIRLKYDPEIKWKDPDKTLIFLEEPCESNEYKARYERFLDLLFCLEWAIDCGNFENADELAYDLIFDVEEWKNDRRCVIMIFEVLKKLNCRGGQ